MTHPFDGLWLAPEDDPRSSAGPAFGEREVLLGYLRHYRTTLELKCSGLDAEQLARRSVPPSTMSLLGLLRHLARVEHHWFQRVLQGKDEPRLYRSPQQPDLDFDGAIADQAVVEDAWTSWRREVAAAEKWLSGDDLDRRVSWQGEELEVRDIVVHMVEEYARHTGHADLLRECVDGRTGQ